jgi:gliding motility-associated-like protein
VITLTLFEDCGTAFIANGPENITATNDCGITGLSNIPLQNVVFQEEVSQLCSAQLPFSECNGGTMPGIYMHQWTDTITLPADCDSWVFSYSSCCRNNSTNAVGTDAYYWETVLNSQTAPCNSSPTVTTQMIPYVCVNQPVLYNLGIYEPDGNTLAYSLVSAATSATGTITYAGGYSGATPIPGVTINSTTGDLSFTPTVVGNYIFAVLVEEFDNNGNLVGSLVQDFQFEVINCPSNTNPVEPAGITNYTGDGVQISSNEIEVCPGDSFCFQLEFTDLNTTDSIFISSNLDVALPGATFTQLTFQSPAIAEICWTATTTVPSNSSVVFNARDNACPMFGITFFPVNVFINPGVYAGPDVTLCAGDTTDLFATGGTAFTWASLPGGDPISIGNNFECDNCQGTYALPSVTTQYEVTSNLTGLCPNKDTVEVAVVPDFAYTLSQSTTTTCIGSDVEFEVAMNPAGTYDIQWSPGGSLDDATSATPVMTTTSPGTYEYAVSIESSQGCVRNDTLQVIVAPATSPDYEVIVSDNNVDCGDTVFFDVNILSAPPAVCDVSINNICDSPSSSHDIGVISGQNTQTSWPAPFGNWYRNAKHQFLYRASELQAAGVQAGKITEISWIVSAINGDTIYYDYTINMGCTSSTELTTWETGLVNVFTPQNVQVVVGTNTMVLSSAYEWDGISNLVVEICYDNRHLNWSNNSITPLTNTTYNSSLVYFSDNQAACPAVQVSQQLAQRPYTTFTYCSLEPDLNNFTFEWQTTLDPVDDPVSDSTFAVVSGNGDFEVVVTNLQGGCADSTTISVTAECCDIDEVLIDDVSCFEGADGGLTIIPYSNQGNIFEVIVTQVSSGTTVYNQPAVVDTAFVNGLPAGDYDIVINTPGGCTSDTTITINEPVEFVVDITGDSIMCFGDSLELVGSAAVNYLWTSAGSFVDNTEDTVWFIGSTSEMIYLEATNAAGCIALDSMQMTVHSLPVIVASNDTSICTNDTISLSASGGTTYTWSPNFNISALTGSSVDVWPDASTDYTVVVENAEGCLDSTTIAVTVLSLPAVDAGGDQSICFGDTATLAGSGADTYTWIDGDDILDPLSENTQAWPTATNTYILEGVDAAGCLNTDTMIITVNSLPTVDAGPDVWVCPSSTVQLQGSSDGVVFSWTPITDLSDPSILMPDASPDDTTMYYLTVESAFGCESMDSMTVYAGGPVPTDAGINDTICEGDSTVIGGVPTAVLGTTFNWTPSASIVDNTIGNPTVFPSVDTWFVVETANDTCTGIDSVFVKVNPYPLANAGADVQICIGDTTQLNATGGVDYSWNTTVDLSDSTIANPDAYPVSTTDFIVTVTDVLGCSQSDTVNVLVNPLPIADAGLNDTICFGDTTQLLATGGVDYLWSPNDSIDDNTIANPLVNPSSSGDYIVEVTDANGCVNTDTVYIHVYALPLVDAGPDVEMCIYDSIQLSVTGAVDYVWSPDSTLNQFNVPDPYSYALDDETFVVEGTDVNGCMNTDTVELTVHSLPVVVAAGDATICFGDTTQISASGATDYLWSPTASLTDTNTAVTNAFPSDSTSYWVVGTDLNGCENTDSVRILVNQLPVANAGLNDTICFGDTTQLNATGGVGFVWTPNDSISDHLIANPLVYPSTTVDYIVEVTDTNGCVNTDTMNVLVNALPPVDAGPDLEMCIYDSIQLSVTGAVDYVWSPDSTLNQFDIANPFSYALDTETFVVEGTDANGCVNTDTMVLVVHNLPIVIASPDTAICIYDTAALSAVGAVQYVWSPTTDLLTPNDASTLAFPQDTITYVVIGTDANNCQNSDSVVVTVNPLPIAYAGLDVDICRGDSTQLVATGGEDYSWSPVIEIIDENIFNPIVHPDTTVEYIVTVIDSNACVNYDSVIVNIFRVGTIADTAICLTDSIQLDVYGSPGNQFTWTPSQGLSSDNIQDPMASPTDDITYTVTVSDVAGCVDQASVDIVVNEIPIIGFSYILIPDCEGVEVEFTDSSFYADDYDWSFSNGENTDDIEPITLFDYGSEASVDLVLTNDYGCSTDSSFTIALNDFNSFYDIHIPNVFTPNGDGQNDYFWVQVPGNLAECLDLKVYNRWGQMIFKSFGGITSWDGKNSDGDEMPDGTYMYTIEIEDFKYEGTVTIFR